MITIGLNKPRKVWNGKRKSVHSQESRACQYSSVSFHAHLYSSPSQLNWHWSGSCQDKQVLVKQRCRKGVPSIGTKTLILGCNVCVLRSFCGPRCSGHGTQRERNRKLLEPSVFQHVLATGEIQINHRKFLSSGSLQSGGLNIHMFY